MPGWLALSDSASFGAAPALMERGLFVAEFTLPFQEPAILVAFQSHLGWERGLSLFVDPQAGISLRHRQGAAALHHRLPGPLPSLRGTARLSFTFDAPARLWRLTFEVRGLPEHNRSTNGMGPLPLNVADLQAMAVQEPGSQRHHALLWFGATADLSLPTSAPWIGPRTLINTGRGPVAATHLRPGDKIATLDQGYMALRGLIRRRLPSRGSFAPILLRSPFFGLSGDILVSSDQLVLISGASVEYLCGVEEALVPALALCDGKVAEREERRAVTDSMALDLGAPALIIADGCCLLSACDAQTQTLPRRALAPFETLPLLALLGRTALRHVA
ncbi:MAG: Hint domain-containing protein [Cypionkella sp.]